MLEAASVPPHAKLFQHNGILHWFLWDTRTLELDGHAMKTKIFLEGCKPPNPSNQTTERYGDRKSLMMLAKHVNNLIQQVCQAAGTKVFPLKAIFNYLNIKEMMS